MCLSPYIPLSIRRIRAFFFFPKVEKIQNFGAQKYLGFLLFRV